MTADELLKLARFQMLDGRNCNEEAKEHLLGLMADEIERLRTTVRDARLIWAMVCPCGCQACDNFYERLKLTDEVGAEQK